MGKFTDDILVPADKAGQPVIAGSLFRTLGVSGAGVQAQAKALEAWLATNTPEPVLRQSLERAGFGWLLAEHDAA